MLQITGQKRGPGGKFYLPSGQYTAYAKTSFHGAARLILKTDQQGDQESLDEWPTEEQRQVEVAFYVPIDFRGKLILQRFDQSTYVDEETLEIVTAAAA